METMKFNIPYLKKWANTVFNEGESNNHYDNSKPIDWNIDQFAGWFFGNAVDGANVANSFTEKVFGVPKGTKLNGLFGQNDGSGFNGDRYWKRFESSKSAIYDVWGALKPKLGGKHNSFDSALSTANESKKPINNQKLIESAIRKIVKKVLKEASLEKDPVRAYIQTALWSTSDMDSDSGDNLYANYSYDDVSPKSISRAKKDLGDFIKKVKQAGLLELYLEDFDYSHLAHDFWLTRNGHGTGFWDRSYSNDGPDGNDLGKAITQIAEQFQEIDGYVGDDGMVYFE